MSTLVLSPIELEEYTGKTERAQKRYGSQARELTALGIPFTPRTDKTLIVLREHVYATARPPTHEAVESPTVSL